MAPCKANQGLQPITDQDSASHGSPSNIHLNHPSPSNGPPLLQRNTPQPRPHPVKYPGPIQQLSYSALQGCNTSHQCHTVLPIACSIPPPLPSSLSSPTGDPMSTTSSAALLKLVTPADPAGYDRRWLRERDCPPATGAASAKLNACRSGEMAASVRLPRSRHRKPRLPPLVDFFPDF
jgi:hypothetical protein